ncbi:hypothetical protein Aple_036200 [Acrocarpospora pleiomorpha]|uniref:Uncharacterized protein n=1 Tax=Acrocarpospora pleiomorpha TaxID=90975 RepID=A0A5M3XHL5_9ACTN|nr:hypothetical protein [Acrocarpospora pleiomorpha]GES20724.1 hypothetical protein Aple_036200 [Acrocarpospora pleiomorpha]
MTTITLSIRETRLVVERLLQADGLAPGAVPAVRDFVILAQAAGLPALEVLESGLSERDRELHGALRTVRDPAAKGTVLVAYCAGQSSYVVAPGLLDLALATPAPVTVRARDVEAPELLAAMEPQAGAHGVRLTVTCGGGSATITTERGSAPRPDDERLRRLLPVTGSAPMARAVIEGMTVPSELWWRLFRSSARALSEESVTSLKHAGATPVSDTGDIEPDLTDDIDFAEPGRT